jgi:cell division protein FtsB|tara:strand:- start:139 stop:420 length:282 start_codon:yes stop_codon:yes gene_type:complete
MRWLLVIFTLLFLILQYRLWVGDGSMAQRQVLQHKVNMQQEENEALRERNNILASEVNDLKNGLESVEERARTDLGMVKEGETFYMVVDKEQK